MLPDHKYVLPLSYKQFQQIKEFFSGMQSGAQGKEKAALKDVIEFLDNMGKQNFVDGENSSPSDVAKSGCSLKFLYDQFGTNSSAAAVVKFLDDHQWGLKIASSGREYDIFPGRTPEFEPMECKVYSHHVRFDARSDLWSTGLACLSSAMGVGSITARCKKRGVHTALLQSLEWVWPIVKQTHLLHYPQKPKNDDTGTGRAQLPFRLTCNDYSEAKENADATQRFLREFRTKWAVVDAIVEEPSEGALGVGGHLNLYSNKNSSGRSADAGKLEEERSDDEVEVDEDMDIIMRDNHAKQTPVGLAKKRPKTEGAAASSSAAVGGGWAGAAAAASSSAARSDGGLWKKKSLTNSLKLTLAPFQEDRLPANRMVSPPAGTFATAPDGTLSPTPPFSCRMSNSGIVMDRYSIDPYRDNAMDLHLKFSVDDWISQIALGLGEQAEDPNDSLAEDSDEEALPRGARTAVGAKASAKKGKKKKNKFDDLDFFVDGMNNDAVSGPAGSSSAAAGGLGDPFDDEDREVQVWTEENERCEKRAAKLAAIAKTYVIKTCHEAVSNKTGSKKKAGGNGANSGDVEDDYDDSTELGRGFFERGIYRYSGRRPVRIGELCSAAEDALAQLDQKRKSVPKAKSAPKGKAKAAPGGASFRTADDVALRQELRVLHVWSYNTHVI